MTITREVVTAFILGHTVGFLLGAVLMYLVLRVIRKALLEIPPTTVTLADVREWVTRNQEIKNLNLTTKEILSRLSGNAS